MLNRINKVIPVLLLAILTCLSTGTIAPASAAEIYQYTAFPPFLPRVVSPNILFVLDYSKSMVRPAYGDCSTNYQNCRYKFFNPNDDFDASASASYAGYFDTGLEGEDNLHYSCVPGSGGGALCSKNPAGEFGSKWLNWLTSTQFDILKKVVVGGDVTASPEQGNPTKLQSLLDNIAIPNTAPANQKDHTAPVQSVPTYKEFYKVVERQVCLDNAPDALCDTTAPQRIPFNWLSPYAATVTDRDLLWSDLYVDDSGKQRALPFTFRYFGQDYSYVNISSNGYIEFTNTENTADFWTSPANVDVPNAAVPNNMVAAFWDDIVVAKNIALTPSFLSVHTVGQTPNRIYVITFNNLYPYGIPATPASSDTAVSFQILLFEGVNQIVFQYNDAVGGLAGTNNTNAGVTATVGLEGPTGTLAKKYSFNGSALLENSLALHMTYGYKVFRVAPGATYTDFRVAGAADAAAYPVNIDITNTAKVGDVCPSGYYLNKFRNNCYNHVTEGLLQEFRDGELAGLLGFRLGIMYFNDADGGKVVKHFNEKDTTGWASLMNSTRSQKPTPEAPIAEALHMAQGYFRQVATNYNLGINTAASSWTNTGTAAACSSTGNNYDPFCFQSAAQKVPCAKSYALLVSAGNYSHDFGRNIYLDPIIADKTPYSSAVRVTTGETAGTNEGTPANGGWIDDIAYKMHTTDLRNDIVDLTANIEGSQTVGLYAVNTFGGGSGVGTPVLKRAALYGGFKDANGDGAYNPGEDVNGNCILDAGEDVNSNGIIDGAEDNCSHPKTYLEAGNGDIRAKIVSAVTDILKNSASGTSVSVLSTSAGGEGALYQAYFYPARIENEQEDRKWPGFLRAFLLDTYQQLRDDYSGNGTPDHTLNTANDRVAQMFLDSDSSEVKVNLFATPGKLADPAPSPTATVTMDNVASMWEGGTQLAKSTKSERHIFLWRDTDNDGIVDNGDFSTITGETMELVEDNASTLAPYLLAQGVDAAAKTAEATKIINFTRGAEIAGYRSRCITIPGATQETGCLGSNQRVWPLGDIIFSTPTLVGAPAEKYDQIYGDQSYFAFYNLYKNRRQVVYLGANDGMLHAFNAGSFNPATISFADNPASGNGWDSPLPGLGDELWSFIPYENLPHLAWLACNGTATDPTNCGDSEYTHVYYVDHRPRVTDARIFNGTGADPNFSGKINGQDGVDHPNGWGSILILPLRLGGGAINVDLNGDGDTLDTGETAFQSGYYAFDVTDAEQPPKLLWRFTAPDLGFTTSYPAIVRVDDKTGTPDSVKWFMVVGSGPQNTIAVRDYNYSALTTQNGKVFVVDLATGVEAHQHTFVTTNNAIMGDPIAVDVNLDFTTDVVYIGSAIGVTAGRVFRINTANRLSGTKYVGETDPGSWSYSDFFDPVTPGNSYDPDVGENMGPLLVSPSVSMDRYGNLWVYFGSGRLKNTGDLTNSQQQRFYGIKDACWEDDNSAKCVNERNVPIVNPDSTTITVSNTPYKLNTLYNSSAVAVSTSTDALDQVSRASTDSTTPVANICGASLAGEACSFQGMITQAQTRKGWYVTLDNPSGTVPSERVLARSSVIGGLVLFTTYQPAGDICSIFGNSSLYAVYYETGTASNTPVVQGEDGLTAEGNISPKIDLGGGMPTSVGIAIGETVSGFVQKSTGEILRIEATPALKVRSRISGWRETTGNTGNAGVETIYEHIIK